MSKSTGTAWLFVYAVLGITGLAIVTSFLLGHPRDYNILGKLLVHFIGFCALNGAYVSFYGALTGLEPDRPTDHLTTGTRLLLLCAGVLVVSSIWGVIWVIA
jgi:hypothetical protein